MITITSSGMTDIGKKRKGNEDALLVDDDLKLYVVADGMGGHQAGEIASRIIVDSIHNAMKPLDMENNGKEHSVIDTTLSIAANRLMAAVYQANGDVYRTAESNESYQGMGSTVSSIFFTDQTLITVNVGDSPIFLLRDGHIETLSTPHTMMAEHEAMAPKGAKPLGPQFRHILTRAMGIHETVDPDICERQVFDNDILVICSDGLSDKVDPEEILGIATSTSPDAACRSLVDLANERGGDDNITVIVLNVKHMTEHQPEHTTKEDAVTLTEDMVAGKQPVSVEYDTEDGSYKSVIQNIGADGIFIETGESFSVGQEISLTFSISDEPTSFMITGKVADRLPQGIHVIFEHLTKDQRNWIDSIQKKI
ncbi:MAG: protein phosphatase 2C domain-containing protein [Desulfobacterales bacterium]|nr:MAG: protein phosphatase 2C domain-containing protein [Desulfobacterales bacterium]